MIVLKHLAKQYHLSPHKLRQMLRNEFGIRRSWRWPDEQNKDYIKITNFLKAKTHVKKA